MVTGRPRILVLLTTHNGAQFLAEQVDSVLHQQGVNVHIVISDDNSTDETSLLLREMTTDARVTVLAPGTFGSAAANFFRLIREVPSDGFDAVSLCDQDDIWEPWKLERHFNLLVQPRGHDGDGQFSAISSNVEAFATNGDRHLIVKNQQQKPSDYAFESGGPGSTFLMRPDAYEFVRGQLLDVDAAASQARAHDWLIYALVRASGRRWFIDGEPSVRYRQHDTNVLGANEGWRQNFSRLREIASGTHRRDVERIVRACIPVAIEPAHAQLVWLLRQVERRDPVSRMRLARQVGKLRRRRRDQLALAGTLLAGLW